MDGLAVGAGDLAGAVGVDGQGPAQLVQHHVVVPPAVILEVGEAGAAAVGAVGDVVGFAGRGGLVAAAGVLACLIPEGDQAAQMEGDVVGLADIQRQGGPGEGLAEQVAAQERRGAAGAGDDLQDLAQDLLLHLRQRGGDLGGDLGVAGCGAGQPGGNGGGGGGDGFGCGLGAELVVFDAEGDQVLDRAGVDVAGDHGDDHRVDCDLPGGVAFQPGAAIPGGDRVGGAVGGPPGPVFRDPLVLEDPVLVPVAQLGEVDVDQRLDRLPGPLRQQVRGQQPLHRLGQRVVVPLGAGPQVPAALRRGQGIQHRLNHRRALGGEVAVDDAGPVERGVQGHASVQVLVVVVVGVGAGGAGPDLG